MERIVIHSDLNNFYASVERKLNPELTGKPLAVCGNKEERRGIVLAKSEEAKKFGVKTGDTIWQAKRKCPNLITVPTHFPEYMEYSRKVKEVYARFTDLIENYGIDECWLDLTKSTLLFPPYAGEKYVGEGEERHYTDGFLRHIGDTVRFAVKDELGLTVSVGVSFNKIYAKLGSDLKKPDGTSVISYLNYKNVIYGLPVSDLLMVGGATARKLAACGYTTIGRLAAADDEKIYKMLGKFGRTLLIYARGEDDDPVRHMDDARELKSIGNSQTYARDLTRYGEVKRMLYNLSESVAARLRESGMGLADTVHLWVRDSALNNFSAQKKVRHTALCGEIAESAYSLFVKNFPLPFAVRALGVTVSGFDGHASQLTLDESCGDYNKKERAERAVDDIRRKYGYHSLQRGIMLDDPDAMRNDIKNTHLIKPARFDYSPLNGEKEEGDEEDFSPVDDGFDHE